MNEIPDQVWVLLGTVAGGLIGGFSQMIASWLQWKREEKTNRRTERSRNLHNLQDELLQIQDFVNRKIEEKNDPLRPDLSFMFQGEERQQMKLLVNRMGNASIRVGDDPLSSALSDAIRNLNRAKDEGSLRIRNDFLANAHFDMGLAELRIGQLLHTNAETDLGINASWFSRHICQWKSRRTWQRLTAQNMAKRQEYWDEMKNVEALKAGKMNTAEKSE